jgi:cytochrome c oxidase subunit 2
MFWTTAVVYVIVAAFIIAAVIRGRSTDKRTSASSFTTTVADGVGLTVAILFVFLVGAVWTGRSIASLQAESAVTISVVGHQWWWEVEYDDVVPSRRVTTANEIHIPLNRPVALRVTSRDVIHSFWAPNLHGKRDLIPGYITAIWLQADTPGIYRGQCAEFCGKQHAHMAFDVIAEPEADYERWLDGMRQPSREPSNDNERRGRDLFMTSRCVGCHTIRGTSAAGRIAPDLTHIGTRSTVGAGTLPNTPEHLRHWIENPQDPKPGNQMPPNPLPAADLDALTAYLTSLK